MRDARELAVPVLGTECDDGDDPVAEAATGSPSVPTRVAAAARELRVCSLNVHGWHNECSSWDGLVAMLAAIEADVIALQEATKHRVPALATALGGLHWTHRHNCAILSRFALRGLDAGQASGVGPNGGPNRTKRTKGEAAPAPSTPPKQWRR